MNIYRTTIASVLLASSVSLMADTGVFVGIVYDFGTNAGPGLSLKLVSDDVEDKAVAAIGVSYFPNATRPIATDLSVGYTFKNSLVTIGYDFMNRQPQLGLGYMDTRPSGVVAAGAGTGTGVGILN